ncbi:OmpA family protein [Roseateles sp. P5_E7]
MKNFNTLRLIGLAGLSSLIAASSFAQESGYAYGGLSVGQSRARIDEERISAGLLGAGFTSTSMTRDEKSDAYRLFGGYQFNRYFAVESGYFSLGKFGFNSTTVPAGTLSGQVKLQGWNLDLVGTLPITERFSAIARLGVQSALARDRFSSTGAVSLLNPNPSKREANHKFGVGLQYEFSRALFVRGEAERYRINDAVGNHGGVNVVSLSLVLPFGRAPESTRRVAMAAPAYVAPMPAPAPAPAPVVAAAPVAPIVATPPVRQRVSFSADSLFGFDQSTVRPEGKAELDTFARDVGATEFDMIRVEGHTDRLGSAAYNQKLSTRRAEAVRDYLVTSGRIPAGKVSAVGMGETAPVTKPGDCKGNKPTKALIACLQPDRRVDVEATGTR